MEELRIEPCIDAGAADSDRKVSLEDNALGVCICTYFRQLLVKMVLYEAPEIDICLILDTESLDFLFAVFCKTFPFREVRSAIGVTEHTESRIWKKP